MKLSLSLAVVCFILSVLLSNCNAANLEMPKTQEDKVPLGRALVEEGRTMVHHAVKRFMIILPAIFFKLGIAFTMLFLVTIVAVNNGFIGFLLLVVGLSSVLARLQEARRPAVVPYISPLPPYHHHFLDRSDSGVQEEKVAGMTYAGIPQLRQTGYYGQYSSKRV